MKAADTTLADAARRAPEEVRRKADALAALLRSFGSVAIGYSGGVDSVFLARAALDVLGSASVLAVTGRSDSYPAVQHRMALACVERFGIPHLEIETGEVDDPRYAANPVNRCYFCKSELWSRVREVADARGLAVVLDGSNADDAGDYRPGMAAALERAVRSPLLEVGLRKAEIRLLSAHLGLPTWDQPAAPCLSSRLPYGLAVTRDRLRQVEDAESLVRSAGIAEFRVRHHGDAARIEAAPGEIPAVLAAAGTLSRGLGELGFQRVLVDVEGYRRGALNEALSVAPAGTAG